MRNLRATSSPVAAIIFAALLVFFNSAAHAAAVETPKGKRIPGQIVNEGDKEYKIGTDLPGGGRIIFNVGKDKVDPHGTIPGTGRIEHIKGKAEIKRTGYPRFVPASKGMVVNPGDEIQTGPGSEVVIALENMAITNLGGNASYTLRTLEVNPETKSTQIQVDLPKGKLWSEVGRLKTKDSSFRIETPAAVTGVRGTVFRVEVEAATSATNVSVVSGQVAVQSKGIEAPEIVIGKEEALVVQPGQGPRKLTTSELLQHMIQLLAEWAEQSEYFKAVTALAGIGRVEEVEVEPALPEAQRQKVFDAIQAGWEKASEDFFQIDKALKLFYLDFARFPSAQEGLNALVSSTGSAQWNGPYIEAQFLKDHYGEPYQYTLGRDAYGNIVVETTTFGYDKKPGTSDDRKKIISEEDARRWEDTKSYR
jgi:hypothetical protein